MKTLAEHEILMGLFLDELELRYIAEYPFHPERKWAFDFVLLDHSIALEIEGGGWTSGRHTRGKGFQDDLTKYQEAFCLGWNVLRFSVKDVESGRAKEVLQKWLKREKAAA